MTFSTTANLGDCLWTLRMLIAVGGQHTFCCKPEYHAQLREVVVGMTIEISGVDNLPADSVDTWIANGRFESQGVRFHGQTDIVEYVRTYLNQLAFLANRNLDLLPSREDMLFPAMLSNDRTPSCDILVVNAQPTSGQCPRFDNGQLNALIERLAVKWHVICTNPTTAPNAFQTNTSIMRIAALSTKCRLIIGIATGPIWMTFNRTNMPIVRHILLDPMRLDYGSNVPIRNHADVRTLEAALVSEGWL